MDNQKHNFPILGNCSRRLWISLLSSGIIATGSAWASEQPSERTFNKTEINVPLQTIVIKGTVTDSSGNSIIGANVLEIGTQNGVITDIDGKFSLSVNKDAVIRIS